MAVMDNKERKVWLSGTLSEDAIVTAGYGGRKTLRLVIKPHGADQAVEAVSHHMAMAQQVELCRPRIGNDVMLYGSIRRDDDTGKVFIDPRVIAFDAICADGDGA
ncbi:hypothetical protein PG2054B_1598 [Bifidobacterium pseudolongum subsp. pseudolongum]|uniref:Uncharacterized protein n=2 Tax=Bifidobacterium pseudolongum TaxID=1694 RepID=A0A4Q5A4F2_9BIFI|nr:hypothetical protein PG2054B_1598 [Bifidobacterium pseudolongum subsp. pseudolongum]